MSTRRRAHRGGAGGYEPAAVVQSRSQRAWELDAAGRSQREIAQELGISQAAVSKIQRREADRLVADRRDDVERERVRLLARTEMLYREAMRGYERSQQDRTRRRQRQVHDADGTVTATVIEADSVKSPSDPRFLEQAGRALERMATLNGLHQHGRTRSPAHDDTSAARDRLAGKLARHAIAGARPLPRDPE